MTVLSPEVWLLQVDASSLHVHSEGQPLRARAWPLCSEGPALCWRPRCPGAARPHRGSARALVLGREPTHTAFMRNSHPAEPRKDEGWRQGSIRYPHQKGVVGTAARSGLGGSREWVWGVGLGLESRVEAWTQDLVKTRQISGSLTSTRPSATCCPGALHCRNSVRALPLPSCPLTGSPSTTSPWGFLITITIWAWKVMISTGPCSIILPIASCRGWGQGGWASRVVPGAFLAAPVQGQTQASAPRPPYCRLPSLFSVGTSLTVSRI